jgi:hypothetical protein
MKRSALTVIAVFALAACLPACGGEDAAKSKLVVKQLDSYKPNLPTVPTIPKPNVPETYPDGSYSVYGLRRQINKTIETQVTVTAYIADIYEKPVCPEGKTCHTIMPHLFLADEKDEPLERRHLRLVGYAKSFKEMEDEQAKAEKGVEEELPEGVYLAPIVWDWREQHKYKITGRFTRQSGEGFMATDGLIEYASHECLDCPEEDEEKEK